MSIQEKLLVTLFWTIGMFVLIKIMRKTNDDIKSGLEKRNPKLLAKAEWFLSEEKKKVVDYLIIGMTIGWIIMVWLNKVDPF